MGCEHGCSNFGAALSQSKKGLRIAELDTAVRQSKPKVSSQQAEAGTQNDEKYNVYSRGR